MKKLFVIILLMILGGCSNGNKIEEKDTLLTYFAKLEDGDSSIDSLCLSYNAKKGLMYNIRKDTTFILIDSLYINKIKKIATKTEFSDD